MANFYFKRKHLEKEFKLLPRKLQDIFLDFADYSKSEFGIIPTITRITEHVEGSSGVHEAGRALDVRNEFMGKKKYSPHKVKKVLEYINEKYPRDDDYKVLVHHKFKGGPAHFHFQTPKEWK